MIEIREFIEGHLLIIIKDWSQISFITNFVHRQKFILNSVPVFKVFGINIKIHLNFNELEIYKQSMSLAEKIWLIVLCWDSFPKYTLGKQWVNASDSISQNISEGFGRFPYKDSKNFYYYARGSLFESIGILEKANNRKLVNS